MTVKYLLNFIKNFKNGIKIFSKKLKTYAHIEYSNDEYSSVSVIKKKIIEKIDLFNRGEKYEAVKIDSSFPQYLVENTQQYKDYILK